MREKKRPLSLGSTLTFATRASQSSRIIFSSWDPGFFFLPAMRVSMLWRRMMRLMISASISQTVSLRGRLRVSKSLIEGDLPHEGVKTAVQSRVIAHFGDMVLP